MSKYLNIENMNLVILVKRSAIFFCLLIIISSSCRKKYAYNYTDGTPGDGATTSSITIDTSVKKVDVSKYPQARVFPGLVCASAPRISVTIPMNLNYNLVQEDLRISVPPSPQFSTGLYAAPGELVIIDIPSNEYSLSVQIGAWTDNLSSILNPPRDPIIYTRSQLSPGRNYVRNLYGGHIYIFAGKPFASPVNISFTNVLKSPDFVLGKTDKTAWQQEIRNSCIPWLELISANVVFVVPRQYCVDHSFTDIEETMKSWDDIVNIDYYQWQGLKANPVDPVDKAPLLPWRMVMDIKPSVGYGHNGFPIVVQNDYSWFDGIGNITSINGGGNWGFFHELGHNNQQTTYWSWSAMGETSCNFFSFKVANHMSSTNPASWPPKHPALATTFPAAITWASTLTIQNKNFDGSDAAINDPFARLTPFVQLMSKIPADWGYPGQPEGWYFITELYKKARRSSRISITDQSKKDFVYETLCEFTHRDMRAFFKAWGITISNISLNKMAGVYPVSTQEIWKYNPLTKTGGDSQADPRFAWDVSANSWSTSEGTNGYISNAFDGSFTTYWHCNYGTGTGPTTPQYTITVDMIVPQTIKGFSAALRQSGTTTTTAVKNIRVQVSTDNVNWVPVTFTTGTIAGAFTLDVAKQGLQSFNLTTPQSVRYFRYIIATTADNNASAATSALAEINIVL